MKLADFIENINKDSEDDSDKSSGKKSVRASAEDETLVQDEEERQEKVKTDQAVAEIVKTSGKLMQLCVNASLRSQRLRLRLNPSLGRLQRNVDGRPYAVVEVGWISCRRCCSYGSDDSGDN